MYSPFSTQSFSADQEAALSSASTLSSCNPSELMQGGVRAAWGYLQSTRSPALKLPDQSSQFERKFTLRCTNGHNSFFDIEPDSAPVSSGTHLLSVSDHRNPSFLLPVSLSLEDEPLGDLDCWDNPSAHCPRQTNCPPANVVPSTGVSSSHQVDQEEVLATTRPPTHSSSSAHLPSAKFPDLLGPPLQDTLQTNAASACTLERVHEQSSTAQSGQFEVSSNQESYPPEAVLCDWIPNFTFPHRPVLPSPASAPATASKEISEPSAMAGVTIRVGRQRPEIPSIGRLDVSPRCNASSSALALPASTHGLPPKPDGMLSIPPFQHTSQLTSDSESASEHHQRLQMTPPSLPFQHGSLYNDYDGLTPPRTPAFGPIGAGSRRRSSSTGALASTYSSMPYSLPANIPEYPPQEIGLATGQPDGLDDPRSLWDLQDPPEGSAARPHYALTTLIRYAILGSETQRLTLQEIYDTIEDRFIFFRAAGKGWKNSVRHNLSLNKCFKRVNRTLLDPGKGSYWYVDLNEEASTPRNRRRRKADTGRMRSSSESLSEAGEEATPQHRAFEQVPQTWVSPPAFTTTMGEDALQTEPVASRLAKTRPRSLSEFTFPSKEQQQQLEKQGQSMSFHGDGSRMDYEAQHYQKYVAQSMLDSGDFVQFASGAEGLSGPPQEASSYAAAPNDHFGLEQVLQISTLDGSRQSYIPVGRYYNC